MGKSFNIIINGGGLGGLAASIALARKGHKVIVLEGAPELNEVGAGIQIPPNSTRIIREFGLEEKFLEKIVWPANINFRRYSTGAIIGATPLHPTMTETYGYPYVFLHSAITCKLTIA
jgi:salicylate hydroxylase